MVWSGMLCYGMLCYVVYVCMYVCMYLDSRHTQLMIARYWDKMVRAVALPAYSQQTSKRFILINDHNDSRHKYRNNDHRTSMCNSS